MRWGQFELSEYETQRDHGRRRAALRVAARIAKRFAERSAFGMPREPQPRDHLGG